MYGTLDLNAMVRMAVAARVGRRCRCGASSFSRWRSSCFSRLAIAETSASLRLAGGRVVSSSRATSPNTRHEVGLLHAERVHRHVVISALAHHAVPGRLRPAISSPKRASSFRAVLMRAAALVRRPAAGRFLLAEGFLIWLLADPDSLDLAALPLRPAHDTSAGSSCRRLSVNLFATVLVRRSRPQGRPSKSQWNKPTAALPGAGLRLRARSRPLRHHVGLLREHVAVRTPAKARSPCTTPRRPVTTTRR